MKLSALALSYGCRCGSCSAVGPSVGLRASVDVGKDVNVYLGGEYFRNSRNRLSAIRRPIAGPKPPPSLGQRSSRERLQFFRLAHWATAWNPSGCAGPYASRGRVDDKLPIKMAPF